MEASETWARLRDRVISWNRMRLTRADSLHGILGDLAVCKKERDDIKAEWNRWVQINSTWIADRAECEMARDEALRDVMQLHDAAIETEDKMDALKADRAALAAALRKAYEGVTERCVNCDRPMDLVLTCPMCGGHEASVPISPTLPADVAELLARREGRKEEGDV